MCCIGRPPRGSGEAASLPIDENDDEIELDSVDITVEAVQVGHSCAAPAALVKDAAQWS